MARELVTTPAFVTNLFSPDYLSPLNDLEASRSAVTVEPVDVTNMPDEVIQAYMSGLPPVEFRHEAFKDPSAQKIPTPLDEKGRVDVKQLIIDVKATVSPAYVWSPNTSRHHLSWPGAAYEQLQANQPATQAEAFRGLPGNIIRVQHTFHNWLHAVTLPPPLPEAEVMQQSIAAWRVVTGFFQAVQDITAHNRIFERELVRRGGYTSEQEAILQDVLTKKLAGVIMRLDDLAEIPIEYWPFSPDVSSQVAAGQVGQLVMRGWQRQTRAVRLREVA